MNNLGAAPVVSSIFGVGMVAVLLPVLFLAVILGFIIFMRYLRYKENLLMIQRGLQPPTVNERRAMRYAMPGGRLRGGIITSLVGLALFFGLLTMGWGPWLLGGLIPLAVGVGEILTFILMTPTKEDRFNDHFDDRE